MRVCKTCHNNMIIVVDCNRPRRLYKPFSHDATTTMLVLTNDDNFSFLESVNISYYLGKSIWSPRQRFLSWELKIKVGPKKFLVLQA